jgi:hypothetical protein
LRDSWYQAVSIPLWLHRCWCVAVFESAHEVIMPRWGGLITCADVLVPR